MINLFDLTSTSFTSDAFLLENQVTIFATGLPVAGEVRFEIVTFRDTPLVTEGIACGVCVDPCNSSGFPASEMVVVSTQRVTCGSCGTDPNNNQVKLTSASSYIVLDAPIGSYIRAVYVGTDLGTFTVGYSRSATRDLTPAMRGCCPLVADLQITKTVSSPRALPNTTLTYTVTATNAGPAAADGSVLMDKLPGGFTVASIAVVYAGGAVGPATLTAAELASFTLTTFPNGATATITVIGQYAQPGYYDNHAVIRAPFGVVDSRLDNNEANAPYTTWHDGSETKVIAGTNMTSVTGTGTIPNPYVINGPLPADGSETKVIAGTNMTSVTGTGTVANPYVVNGPLPADGSETKVIAGTNITSVTGTGTVANPYVVNAPAPPVQVAPTRCDGGSLQPTDRVLVLGDLKKCVAGVVTPLACGDIVQVLTDCASPSASTDVWVSNAVLRNGVCIATLNPVYSANLRAIGSFRTLASLDGNFGFSGANPGQFGQIDYTNTTGTPVLIEATLTGRGNAYAYAGTGAMGFIFNIGTVLGIDPDNGWADSLNPGFSRGTLMLRGPDGFGAGGQYQDVTIDGAKYVAILPAGASVTLYGQAWGVLFQSNPLPNGIVVHAGFDMQMKVTRNAATL